MNITVRDEKISSRTYTLQEIIDMAPVRLSLAERVPGAEGEAFDFKAWYRSWKQAAGGEQVEEPTHLRVKAQDEFQALMSWSELDQAVFLYAQGGAPLQKGYPLRLYVPDGSSACLNVKSVIDIEFIHDSSLGEDASYGFENRITPEALKLKK
jgi:hypothetical protein